MKSLIIFGVLLSIFGISQTCRCPPLEDPAMCRTKYLMLVRITEVSEVAPIHHFYQFQLLRDISYPTPFTNTFTKILTGYDSASCFLQLEVGKVYLLGGYPDTKTNILSAGTCNTYWREWTLEPNSAASDAELANIENKCKEFHKTQ